MKYLVIGRSAGIPCGHDSQPESLNCYADDLDRLIEEKELEAVYATASGGYAYIIEGENEEELWTKVHASPVAGCSQMEVIPIVDAREYLRCASAIAAQA